VDIFDEDQKAYYLKVHNTVVDSIAFFSPIQMELEQNYQNCFFKEKVQMEKAAHSFEESIHFTTEKFMNFLKEEVVPKIDQKSQKEESFFTYTFHKYTNFVGEVIFALTRNGFENFSIILDSMWKIFCVVIDHFVTSIKFDWKEVLDATLYTMMQERNRALEKTKKLE
jgi:hypothetical protein